MARKRVAVLISGRGSNMAALIEAAKDARLSGRDRAGGVQRPDAGGLAARARGRHRDRGRSITRHSARTARRSSARCRTMLRAAPHRARLPRRLHAAADAVVRRAGDGRMLNIHPALLPAFKGLDTHARALAAGAKEHGATVHFVVPEMDAGPIIAQARCRCAPATPKRRSPPACSRSSTGSIRWRCRLVAEGRVRIADGRCLIDGQPAVADRNSKTRPRTG